MDLIWVIYLMDWLSDGNPFIGFGGIVLCAIALCVIWFLIFLRLDIDDKSMGEEAVIAVKPLAHFKGYIIAWVVFCMLGVIGNAILPSKDTAYKMFAAYGITEIAKTDEAQRIGGKTLEVLEKAMDQYLKESEKTVEASD